VLEGQLCCEPGLSLAEVFLISFILLRPLKVPLLVGKFCCSDTLFLPFLGGLEFFLKEKV
jgi:hypothetical protein